MTGFHPGGQAIDHGVDVKGEVSALTRGVAAPGFLSRHIFVEIAVEPE